MKKLRISTGILALTVYFFAASVSNAQVISWSSLGSGPGNGTNGNVYAITTYSGNVVAAGSFTAAGGINARNIAMWNGIAWLPLGSGVGTSGSDTVYALGVFNGELYAGGYFTSPGSNIAKWNGSGWASVGGGTDGEVYALNVFNGELIAGGDFSTAGSVSANNIARWNGTAWNTLGTGLTGSGDRAFSLAIFSGELIAAGRFDDAGGSIVNNIARWNGSSWSALGNGSALTNERIHALTVHSSQLFAGGRFTVIGGIPAYYIARWNGSSWSALAGGNLGDGDRVLALASYNGELVMGGNYKLADTLYVSRVAKWNGSSWFRMETGVSNSVKALWVSDSSLYTGGEFTVAGGRYINRIARWGPQLTSTVQGQVRYADNNQPVPAGKVRILRYDVATREVMVVDSASFSNGDYILPRVLRDSLLRVIIFPNDELDYVPTYHPSNVDWQSAVPVNTFVNQTNINVSVIRITQSPQNPSASNVSGCVYLNIAPPQNPLAGYPYWKDAVVYLKQGSAYRRFQTSDDLQKYSIQNIAPGTYDVFVNRLGYTSATATITVSGQNLDSVNFYLDTLNIIGLHGISSIVPEENSLSQNYPNPFNPFTLIGFKIKESGLVRISVFDVAGREVYVLVNDYLAAGEYRYVFDGTRLSSGVYFYRIITDKFSGTRKMVLIK